MAILPRPRRLPRSSLRDALPELAVESLRLKLTLQHHLVAWSGRRLDGDDRHRARIHDRGGARPLQDGSGILPGRGGSDARRGLDCAVAEAVRAVSRRDTGAGIRKENRFMPENEAKAVPATNETSSFEPLTGPAGPLAVSETNPRYF